MIRRALLARPPLPAGWRLLIAAGIVYTIVLIVVVVARSDESRVTGTLDFRDFWVTAGHFRTTGEIRTDLGVHNYLPFFVIFMTPWSLLPLPVAAALFTALSLALFGVTVAMIELLLAGGIGRGPRRATLIGLLLALPYVHATAVLGQVNVLVLYLVVAAWLLALRGREWAAGTALGLAVLIKLLPALLVVFFLLQRRWRIAAAAVGTGMLFGFGMPLATLGWSETVRQHQAFYERAIVGHSAVTTFMADKPTKAKYSNNAMPMVLRRLLSPMNGDPHDDGRVLLVNVADWPRPTLVGIYFVVLALVVGATALVTIRRGPGRPLSSPRDLGRMNAQFAAWCAAALLAAPLVWTHYLVLAFPGLALLADRLERQWLERRRVCRAAALALTAWLIGALLLTWPAARAAGAQIWSVLILWAAVLIVARSGAAARDADASG